MRQFIPWLAIVWALTSTSLSFGGELDDELRSLWESLWTQTGYPLPLSRWERSAREPLHIRFSGYDANRQKTYALKAVSEVVSAAGLTFTDVSDEPDAEKTATIHIEYLSPLSTSTELGDRLACVAIPKRNDRNLQIESVRIVVKDGQAATCMHHELMHAMGIPGHPSGKSLLSYFPWRQDQLSDFDKRLLKAWYAHNVYSGQPVFEALGPLSRTLANSWSDGTFDANQTNDTKRTQFVNQVIQEMERFASGNGEIPVILRRSGMTSHDAITAAKGEIAFNLGLAYQSGELVTSNTEKSIQWYERAASHNHVMAHVRLYYLYVDADSPMENPVKAYQWLTMLSKHVSTPQIQDALQKQRARLTEDQIEQALKLVTVSSQLPR